MPVFVNKHGSCLSPTFFVVVVVVVGGGGTILFAKRNEEMEPNLEQRTLDLYLPGKNLRKTKLFSR